MVTRTAGTVLRTLAVLAAAGLIVGCSRPAAPDLGGPADVAADASVADSAPTPSSTTAVQGDAADHGDVPGHGDTTALGDPTDLTTVRDGTWRVGEAGEVDFTAAAGALQLIEVRAAEGWTVTEREIEPDDIEVGFRSEGVAYVFEVELTSGVMVVEVDQDIDNVQPGRYEVGDAGAVGFTAEGGLLQVVDAVAAQGWEVEVTEEGDDDIEVDFRCDNRLWQIDVDLEDDDGQIEIRLDYSIRGPFPG